MIVGPRGLTPGARCPVQNCLLHAMRQPWQLRSSSLLLQENADTARAMQLGPHCQHFCSRFSNRNQLSLQIMASVKPTPPCPTVKAEQTCSRRLLALSACLLPLLGTATVAKAAEAPPELVLPKPGTNPYGKCLKRAFAERSQCSQCTGEPEVDVIMCLLEGRSASFEGKVKPQKQKCTAQAALVLLFGAAGLAKLTSTAKELFTGKQTTLNNRLFDLECTVLK